MIINRYLTREVMSALLIVVSILMLAFLSQQVVRYLNYVAIGKIPTNILLQLISFEIPYLLALLLPLGLYLGILLAYGRLHADHEMAILQMSGFGNRRILRLTMWIGLVVMTIVLSLMLWVNPWISAKRQVLMKRDGALHLIQTMIPGRFQVSPDGTHVMFVEKMSLDRERAENVFIAKEKQDPDHPDQRTWMLVLANQGYQTNLKGFSEPFFVTVDGYRYEGTPGENDYKIIQFKKYMVRILQPYSREIHQDDEALPTSDLWQEYNHNATLSAQLQWRISIALSALLLALLAVPLSYVRPRKSRYIILLPAILIYMVYINMLYVARHWVVQSYVPISLGMWWVHSIPIVLMLLISWLQSRQLKSAAL